MRYDEMVRAYPQIEDLFASVAGQIREGRPVVAVMAFTELRVRAEIHRSHQQPVIDKLAHWAQLVEEKAPAAAVVRSRQKYPAPDLCPICGSIDTAGGKCRWCRKDEYVMTRGIKMLSEAIIKIENQRKGFKPDSNEDGVCQVLIQFCREDPAAARILATTDKTVKDCFKKMEDYAKNHKVGSGYYMGPDTARRIIYEFYGIVGNSGAVSSAAALSTPPPKADVINILDLL